MTTTNLPTLRSLLDHMYSCGWSAEFLEEGSRTRVHCLDANAAFVNISAVEMEYVWWQHDDETAAPWSLILPYEGRDCLADHTTGNERFNTDVTVWEDTKR